MREGERVFVWIARFPDRAALDAHLAALHASPPWQDALAALPQRLPRPPQLLRLEELRSIQALAGNANARIYIGFDKPSLPKGDVD